MKWLRWFLAGAFAVPAAHHVLLAVYYAAGIAPVRPYSLTPTKPFGVPQVFSLMFWGGVWGLILGAVLLRIRSPRWWWTIAILFGAIAPTIVAALIAPLKGQQLKPTPMLAFIGFTVNAAWGLGTAVFYRMIEQKK